MADPSSISFDHAYLEYALKHQWEAYVELRREIVEFKPKPLEGFRESREQLLAYYRKLNPESDIESLQVLADGQISCGAREEVQFYNRFDRRLMTVHVTVAFLSHALCEAIINAILAVGLVEKDTPELFTLLERAEIKDKWRSGPKAFIPTYSLDPGSALGQTLQHLARRRNALTHHKINLLVGGQKVLSGSDLQPLSPEDNLRWTERYFSLPFDLASHALSHGASMMGAAVDRRPIPVAQAHR